MPRDGIRDRAEAAAAPVAAVSTKLRRLMRRCPELPWSSHMLNSRSGWDAGLVQDSEAPAVRHAGSRATGLPGTGTVNPNAG